MKKIFIYFFLFIIIISIYIGSKNSDFYKNKLNSIIREFSDLKVNINDNVKIKLLPYPRINIQNFDISQKDLIDIKGEADLYLDLLQIFKGKFILKEVKFNKARIIYYQHNSNDKINLANLLFSKFDKLNSISFSNSNLVHISPSYISSEYENLNFKLTLGSTINFNSSFELNKQNISISGNFAHKAGRLVPAHIIITSGLFDGSIDLKEEGEGTLNLKIKDLAKFSETYLATYSGLLNFNVKNIIDLKSDLSLKNDILNIKNLILSSDNVKLNANMNINLSNKSLGKLDIIIEELNLDNLYSKVINEKYNRSNLNLAYENGENFNINIKSLIYRQQKLENIKINGKFSDNKIILEPIFVKLPFDSKLELTGNISNNKYRNIFEGNIIIIGTSIEKFSSWIFDFQEKMQDSKYIIRSKIYLTPVNLYLENLNILAGNSSITGNISRKILNSKPKIYANLDINNFDFDKFFSAKSWFENFSQFRENLTKENYLLSFQWLRSLDYELNGDISLYNSKLNEVFINKFQSYINLLPSKLYMKNFDVISNIFTGKGNLSFTTSQLKPNLNLNIKGTNFDLVNAEKIFGAFSDRFENYRLDRFNGKIDLSFDNITSNKGDISQFLLKTHLASDRINIDMLKANLWNGNIELKGYITPQKPDFGFSFGLSNIDSEKLYNLFNKQNFVQGKISLSGSLYSTKNDKDLISNLEGNCSIMAKNILIEGADIQSIVDFAREKNNYDQAIFDKVMNNAISGGKTILNKVDGRLKISKSILQTNSLIFSSKDISGLFAGSFDLKNKLMNSTAKINFIPAPSAKATPIILRLKGNFDSPEKSLETNILADFLKRN